MSKLRSHPFETLRFAFKPTYNLHTVLVTIPRPTPAEEVKGDRDAVWERGWGAGPRARFTVTIPRLEGSYTGTGDLTAALLVAQWSKQPGKLCSACVAVIRSVHAVCRRTRSAAGSEQKAREQGRNVLRAAGLLPSDEGAAGGSPASAGASHESASQDGASEDAGGAARLAADSKRIALRREPPPELRILESADDLLRPPEVDGVAAAAYVVDSALKGGKGGAATGGTGGGAVGKPVG